MNTFMNGLKSANNYTLTENGAITHRTTQSDLLDMFALGGAYRNRSDDDVKLLFRTLTVFFKADSTEGFDAPASTDTKHDKSLSA